MKLKTELRQDENGAWYAHDPDPYQASGAVARDAAAAHALKQAEREADALFNASTRWFRARAWINTRADSFMSQWGFDTGEDA